MTPVVAPTVDEYEQWENTTAGRVALKFFNEQGVLKTKVIDSFRKFQITTKERKMNQEMVANESLDFFQNGMLAPVRLIESADDVEKLRSNPNVMSEAEMVGLLGTGGKKTLKSFQERIEAINNPFALTRFLEIARNDDHATAKQVVIIEQRLRAVSPSNFVERETVGGPPHRAAFPGAVSTSDLGR